MVAVESKPVRITGLLDSRKRRVFDAINNFDLTKVKQKLCESTDDDGKAWDMEFADQVEVWYKRFLQLHLLTSDDELLPPKVVDFMWHAHILFTRQYHQDCQRAFGEYFHHGPFTGTAKALDLEDLKQKALRTSELFEKHFGKAPFDQFHWFCNNCSKCGLK